MTAKERVLMIRLMEKLEKHPAYAKALGHEATDTVNKQNMKKDTKGIANV